jgi:hypothetical protein
MEQVLLRLVELVYRHPKEQVTFLQDTLLIYHQMLVLQHGQVEYMV